MNLCNGIHHVSINVDDLQAALDFYVGKLGLEVVDRPDLGFPGAWLSTGGHELHLLELPDQPAPDAQHFAFRVADVDQTIGELRDAGIEVSDAFEVQGGGRQAFFRDPAGNLLELNQPTAL